MIPSLPLAFDPGRIRLRVGDKVSIFRLEGVFAVAQNRDADRSPFQIPRHGNPTRFLVVTGDSI